MNRAYTTFLPIGLGTLSLGLQIVFIRMLLEIFHGNELAIGWLLTAWLIGTSSGAFFFAKLLKKTRIWDWFLLGLFPIIFFNYIFIKFIPKIFHIIPGITPSLLHLIPISFLAIMPAAILCGLLFPYISEYLYRTYGREISFNINKVYIWESVGSLLASFALNFLLFHLLSSLQIVLFFIIIFSLPLVLIKSYRLSTVVFMGLGLLLYLCSPLVINKINQSLFIPYTIIQEKETPYGNIKLMKLEDQLVLVNQGIIEYSSPDIFTAETNALLPVLLHPKPKRILMVGGNLTNVISYFERIGDISELDFLERDPYLVDLQKRFIETQGTENALHLNFIVDDIRSYFRKTTKKYDVICLNHPEPVTLSLNRVYTSEFYSLIEKCLSESGLYFFAIQSSENYLDEYLAQYINLLKNTLTLSFKNVFIIPGDQNYFLASDSLKFSRILDRWIERLQQYDLDPQYLSEYYLNYRLSPERLLQFSGQLDRWKIARINTDFNLNGYVYHFRIWSHAFEQNIQEYFEIIRHYRFLLVVIILLTVLLLKMLLIKKEERKLLSNLFLVGGISLALEMILLLVYQILFATLYESIAIIFGIYMLGLAVGAYLQNIKISIDEIRLRFRKLNLRFFLICVSMLFFSFISSHMISNDLFHLVVKWIFIPGLIYLTGFYSGHYFALTTASYFLKNRGSFHGVTYGIDLAGGIFSAFLTSILLIPLFGISGSLVVILILIIILFI